MDVQTITRLTRIGLGHEGRVHLVIVGDVLDQALEQHGVIARLDRVGDVMQVDFELCRGAFLDDCVGRNALLLRTFKDVLKAVDVFVQVIDQVDLCRMRAFAGDRRAGRLRATVHVLLIDQVELQLECGADGQAHFVELGDDLAQYFTRVGEKRVAFEFVHGHQQLRSRALLPWLVAQGVGDGITDSVSITDIQAQAGAFHRGAIDIQSK